MVALVLEMLVSTAFHNAIDCLRYSWNSSLHTVPQLPNNICYQLHNMAKPHMLTAAWDA